MPPRPSNRTILLALIAAGVVARLVIFADTARLGTKIGDEQHYAELATSLVEGRGFAWATGQPTSLRPPLYPALVAALWSVTGAGDLQSVRLVQFAMSALTAWLVFLLGRRVFDIRTAVIAAVVVWVYPALVYLDFLLLTETLFTLLVVAFVWLAIVTLQDRTLWAAIGCGLALGLGALTRSVLWPVPIVLCPLLTVFLPRGRARIVLPVLVLAGYSLAVVPWAVRNTRLQGVTTVVDTMGGLNLRMGNYEHTPEHRMWDAVSLTGEKSWVYAFSQEPGSAGATEGVKDKWAQRKALEYMAAHPLTTARRTIIKFGDFWGLDRSFLAGVQHGLYDVPTWLAVAGGAAMLLSGAALVVLGACGIWLTPPASRLHVLLLLPVLVLTGVHSLVFGHPRYHLPLAPLLALYAVHFYGSGHRSPVGGRRLVTAGLLMTLVTLAILWARQLALEGTRIVDLLRGSA